MCGVYTVLSITPQLAPGSSELEGAVESLEHDLMRLEMQLVEQLDVRKATT